MSQDGNTPPAEGRGSLLGPYRLLETLGEGGFGTVFRAEQSQPVQRQVALKILKLGMDTRQVVARFEAERQALAVMDHPAIAKVYDAGATDTGRPYFVMELVDGKPLTDYCEAHGLDTRERLELFGDVCLAVQHAHQKGVLHRDLKPSNVLVVEVNGVPLPKVIDFGIAKAIERPLTDSTLATEAFQIMGTPEYMSPEQAAGSDVDTRADVYALGVLLYEMLTRTRPLQAASEIGGLEQLGELLRQIHEVTPPKPSTRISELGKGALQRSASDTRVLMKALRGDLDWIVMKALEKDRERRYSSAAELADDVARYLASEPVSASPPSTTYRMRKFVRRNRLAVGSAAVISATLVASTIGLGVLYARSIASEKSARREAETSRQALGFMTEMFEVSDPSQARGETVTAREILDLGAERIERELGDQPAIRSTLMMTMGEVYRGLGLLDRSEELISSAGTLREELLGAEHPDTLRASGLLATVWERQARFARAEELLRGTIEAQRRVLGLDHIDTLGSRATLSLVLERQSKLDEAEAVARETREAAQRTLGEDHEFTLLAMDQLGIVYQTAGRYEEAEELNRRVLSARRRTLGDDHPDTLTTIANLALVAVERGHYDEAEALFLEAEEAARRVYGEEHQTYLGTRFRLGLLYHQQNRFDDALEVHREVLATQRRTLGDGHFDTLITINAVAGLLPVHERFEEAEELFLEALDGFLALLGQDSEWTLDVQGNLAFFYMEAGRLKEAEEWGTQAYDGMRALFGEEHPNTVLLLENLGNVYYQQGDLSRTLEILEQVLEARRRALGNEHPAVTRTLNNFCVVLVEAGELARATAVREELLERTLAGLGFDYATVADEIENLCYTRFEAQDYEGAAQCNTEVLRIRMELAGPDDPETLKAVRDRMTIAGRNDRWAEVEPHAREYYDAHVRGLGEDHAHTLKCVERIVLGYESQGDEELAAAWRVRLPDSED